MVQQYQAQSRHPYCINFWKRWTIPILLTLPPVLDAMSRETCVGFTWLVTVALKTTLHCIAHLVSNTRNQVPCLSPLLGHVLWLKCWTCICIWTWAYQYFNYLSDSRSSMSIFIKKAAQGKVTISMSQQTPDESQKEGYQLSNRGWADTMITWLPCHGTWYLFRTIIHWRHLHILHIHICTYN